MTSFLPYDVLPPVRLDPLRLAAAAYLARIQGTVPHPHRMRPARILVAAQSAYPSESDVLTAWSAASSMLAVRSQANISICVVVRLLITAFERGTQTEDRQHGQKVRCWPGPRPLYDHNMANNGRC
jgi:hypothetical protein